jgi:hypothetical protein
MRILLALAVLLFVFSGESFSQNKNPPTGFQTIPFGVDKASFVESFNSISNKRLEKSNNFMWVNDFELGEKKYTLWFFFNLNNKFYKYSFQSEEYSANLFDTDVKYEADYLSKIFQEKFGTPIKTFDPNFFDVKDGYETYYRKWGFKKQTVYVCLSTYEFKYSAKAFVSNDSLEAEQVAANERKTNESAKAAANQF